MEDDAGGVAPSPQGGRGGVTDARGRTAGNDGSSSNDGRPAQSDDAATLDARSGDGPDTRTVAGDAGREDMRPAAQDGTDAAAPAQCGSNSLCEGFEDAAEGAYAGAVFQTVGGSGSHYQVTGDRVRTGRRSIKVVSDAVGSSAGARRLLRASLGAAVGDGKNVFSRVWMYFPALPKVTRSGKDPHYRLIRSSETIASNVEAILSAGIVGSERGRMLYFKPIGFKDCAADGAVLPAGKWTCVELRSDASGYQAWIDDQSMGSRNVVTRDECWQRRDRVANVAFGFEMAAGELAAPLTFYMDDIAISDKRLGCE